MQSCAVCARTCWLEDMNRLQLFVEARAGRAQDVMDEAGIDSADENPECDNDLCGGVPRSQGVTKGWKLQEIDATKVEQVHARIFDVRRYCKLWPSIPEIELLGSCVAHPSGKYDDGTPWMWLLNTAAIPSPVTKHTACFVCRHCGQSLTRKTPAMPKFALANSLWIGRYPLAFKCGNKPLSVMTFLLLSLGRAVVQKIVAERHKPGPVREKQKGIRANTIAFPQAKLHELQTAHLPPKAEDATRFVSETISIALVGCDPEAGSVSLMMHFAVFCINMSLYSTFIHLTVSVSLCPCMIGCLPGFGPRRVGGDTPSCVHASGSLLGGTQCGISTFVCERRGSTGAVC